jgi:hypothetical protein
LWQFSQLLLGLPGATATLNRGFVAGAGAVAWHTWQYVRSALAVAPWRFPGSQDAPRGCTVERSPLWQSELLKHPGGEAGSNAGVGAGTFKVFARSRWQR